MHYAAGLLWRCRGQHRVSKPSGGNAFVFKPSSMYHTGMLKNPHKATHPPSRQLNRARRETPSMYMCRH
eukprot:1617281-Alexandrium_andersonii.AAC.1